MPVRGGSPKAEETQEKRPARGEAKAKPSTEKAEAPKGGEKKVVQKSILEERVKKFIAEVDPEMVGKMNDIFERAILDNETKEKANVVFTAFSTNGADDEDVDDTFNIKCIKDILFHYHTMPEKAKGGKALVVEVVPPTSEGDPHLICFHELS